MQNIPEVVQVGLAKDHHHKFDDLSDLKKYKAPYKIIKVKVQYGEHHVIGTQFTYATACGQEVKGHDIFHDKPFGNLFGHVHEQTFELGVEDAIRKIFVWEGEKINGLGFLTYKGLEGVYGHKTGALKEIHFHEHTFGCVAGGYKDHLDWIIFSVHPLHEDQRHLIKLIL